MAHSKEEKGSNKPPVRLFVPPGPVLPVHPFPLQTLHFLLQESAKVKTEQGNKERSEALTWENSAMRARQGYLDMQG